MTFYALPKIRELMLLGANAVVISDNLDGHRIEWMRVFAARCNSIGRKCIFLLPKGSEDQTVSDFTLDSNLIICNVFGSRRDLINFIDSIRTQNWYFCWDADNWMREIAFAKQRISSLVMRPYLASLKITSVVRFLGKCVFVGFQIFVRGIPVYLLRIPMHKSRFLSRYWVDDPNFDLAYYDFEFEDLASNEIDILHTKNILIPGFISMRKNPLLAIEACKEVRLATGDSFKLKLTGKIEAEVFQNLTKYKFDWILVTDRYLTRAEYLKELRASNLVLLLYENIGSSGVVIDSLKCGVPVLLLKNRFWKSLEMEANGLVTLGEKSVSKLAFTIEQILMTKNSHEFQFGQQAPARIATGFDKMIFEIQA